MSTRQFVMESNRIEGIDRNPYPYEVLEHERFLELEQVTVDELVKFVGVYQPDAMLRSNPGISGVRVGGHVAPPSSPEIVSSLECILRIEDPHEQHCEYETLHPFTDGNGRSGRALWAWNNKRYARNYGFLRGFYYETLSRYRK